MKISADKHVTRYDMNDDWFLESDIQTVNEEVVGHSCQKCPKNGMDDEEFKAHAICHVEEGGIESEPENFTDNTNAVKSRAKRKRIKVGHIKCTFSQQEDSEHLVYTCTLCGNENIHFSVVSAHIKKQCVSAHILSELISRNDDTRNFRALSTKDEASSIFKVNYGNTNILEEIVTLFNPLISDSGVSTCDVSALEAEQKTVSKQSLVSCIATASDSSTLQSALVYESIGMDDNPFSNLMKYSVAEESNSFKCTYCRESFLLEVELSKHQETCHADCQNNLLCLICGRSFSRRNDLKRHVETHEVDPSQCGVCNKTFHNKIMLETHTMMHTGKHPFKCSMCDKGFIFSSSLKKHMLKEHKVLMKDYQCNNCTCAFKTKRGLKKHKEREHEGGENRFLCPTCGKTFSTSSTLAYHMFTHGPRKHVCEVCGFGFYSSYMLRKHMVRHGINKNCMCETCGEMFHLPVELKHHVFNQHTDDLPSKCTHCDKAFKYNHRLQRHMIFAHRIIPEGKQVLSCEICNQLFLNKSRLKDHMNLHTGARPYSCSECSHKCRNLHTLAQHKKVHAAVRKPKNSFPCSVCSKKFKNERTWRLHNQSVHLMDAEKAVSFPCTDCEKSFAVMWMLNRHKILAHSETATTGSRRYCCDLCEESFPSYTRLINHKRETHSVEIAEKECPLFQCTQCDKSYRTMSSLYQHKQKKHSITANRTYPCKLCGKILKSSTALFLHGRCIHGLNPRDYKCNTCGKNFKLKGGLNSHLLTHVDIKDRKVYTCGICFKDLTTKWSYEVHMRVHKGIKPHVCDICGRAFTQSGDRNKHRLNTHREILQANESKDH